MDENKKNNNITSLNNTSKNSNSGVEFNEEYNDERQYYPETSKIIEWVINYSGGLVKDKKQASYILIAFIIITVVISLFLIRDKTVTPPDDIQFSKTEDYQER